MVRTWGKSHGGSDSGNPSSSHSTSARPPKKYLCLENTFIVLGSFSTSVALINTTKWIFYYENFKFPFFLTMLHAFSSYVLAYSYFSYMDWKARRIIVASFKYSPSISYHVPVGNLDDFDLDAEDDNIIMPGIQREPEPSLPALTLKEQFYKIVPFSVFGAGSVAASNVALLSLYPSFHEMIQNTTPFWTLAVMVTFAQTRYNWISYLAMIPVCGGGILCGLGEINLDFIGIFFSISSTVLRAFRVMIQGKVLCDLEEEDEADDCNQSLNRNQGDDGALHVTHCASHNGLYKEYSQGESSDHNAACNKSAYYTKGNNALNAGRIDGYNDYTSHQTRAPNCVHDDIELDYISEAFGSETNGKHGSAMNVVGRPTTSEEETSLTEIDPHNSPPLRRNGSEGRHSGGKHGAKKPFDSLRKRNPTKKKRFKMDSMALLYYSSPFNGLIYLVWSVLAEGKEPWTRCIGGELTRRTYFAIVFSFLVASVFNLFAFLMVARLGPLTSMAIGNLKNVAIIIVSVILFHNTCSPIQILGFAIVSCGVTLNSQYGKEVMK